MKFTNFFETIQEAQMRLNKTVVMYDGLPYLVLAVVDHADGIFRAYLQPIGWKPDYSNNDIFPRFTLDYAPTHPSYVTNMDAWMTAHPNSPILRKMTNSPAFNKFRPFPLGMCNVNNGCYYVERQPQRKTEQGLTQSALQETPVVTAYPGAGEGYRVKGGRSIDFMSESFRDCILGSHPSAKECLEVLKSGNYENEAVAFNRDFALAKGPIGMIFIAYKTDIIGYLPKLNFDYVVIGDKFKHCREAVRDLKLFNSID